MDAPFRLLVYSIAALAVIGLFYYLIYPLLLPPENSIEIIEKSLRTSETGNGMSFTSEIFFRDGDGIQGETFDTKTRNVAFQCNGTTYCCPQGTECPLAIEWDKRKVEFNKPGFVPVTTRCDTIGGLYACNIYFGNTPAQIEIESLDFPKEADLGQGPLSFSIKIKNTGQQDSNNIKVEVNVFQRYLEEGQWIERPVETGQHIEELGVLEPEEEIEKTISFGFNQNGEFKAKIKVSGVESGFEEHVKEFRSTGATDKCRAASCEKPEYLGGKCTARCHCEQCIYGYKCQEKILASNPEDLGLSIGGNLSQAQAEILSSNDIDLALPEQFCLSDIIIEEPNAVLVEIGFKLKNVSTNPVKKPFSVKAYTNYGQAGQQLVGSTTVLPEEINQDGEIIKSVRVNLPQGGYQISLVANEEKDEKEIDYGNNLKSFTYNTPDPGSKPTKKFEFEHPAYNPTATCCGKPFYDYHIVENAYATDLSGTLLTLEEAIIQGMINLDIFGDTEGYDYMVYLRVQNTSRENLKILIPVGQVFVDETRAKQNLARIHTELVLDVPLCKIWVGKFEATCLNRMKTGPWWDEYMVGRVITEPAVLNALEDGDQLKVWNVIDKLGFNHNTFGSEYTVYPKRPTLLDRPYGPMPSEQECIDAGYYQGSP
jgi:hypothetical protein